MNYNEAPSQIATNALGPSRLAFPKISCSAAVDAEKRDNRLVRIKPELVALGDALSVIQGRPKEKGAPDSVGRPVTPIAAYDLDE